MRENRLRKCLYCGHEKNEEDFSQEHVIPKAIGGNLIPANPFAIRNVCKRCNSLSGTYIDGPFIKNWMNQNYRAENIMRYADINSRPVLPLRYMGVLQDLKYGDKVCDFWLGPTGDTIYHFHDQYPEEPDVSPMIGIPTFAKRTEIDHGFAFLFVRSNNPAWHPTIAYSFIEQFKNSMLYLGNGPTPRGGGFSDIPTELLELHQRLKNMSGKQHEGNFVVGIHYGDRFLAKVALGLGSILLRDTFIGSKSAEILRKFMWTQNSKQRSEIPIHGTGFWGTLGMKGGLKEFMVWPGGHLLYIAPFRDKLLLYASFYAVQEAVIQISSEPEHWSGLINDGLVFVITPGLQRFVGPKPVATFIGHKLESEYQDSDLASLEEEMKKYTILPPFDI